MKGISNCCEKGNQELVDQINSTLAKFKAGGDIERFVVEANEMLGDKLSE
ncbi:hypothetical protein [Paenibacillus pabuli]